MNFTESQREAILARGGSVLVSAGAGSGKTRVLTERLMEYVDPQITDAAPENIDRFLIITFTRAAAAELRARITDAIAGRLQQNPTNAHLRRQMILCRSAQIGTIDSFCGNLLREYAGAAGVSPAFHVLEEERSERLRDSAMTRVLERRYEEGSASFLELADSVGAGRDDSRLSNLVLKLHARLQSHARPDQWIREQMDQLTEESADIAETPWGKVLLDDALEEAEFWRSQMRDALLRMQEEEKIRSAYELSFRETAEALEHLTICLRESWDHSMACFPIPFPRINVIQKNPDPELTEELKAVRTKCKKSMEKLAGVFSETSEALLTDLAKTAPYRKELLSLAQDLETEFQRSKRRNNALDFSDLEHLTIRLLENDDGTPTELAGEIASRYTEVMIDEYQDVSRIQDRIFHAISRGGENLFFVGDLKQSIYRFRLADPGIFTEKSRYYEENRRGERVIRLQENFRSRPEILNTVNAVFRKCMSERLGDLNYGSKDELKSGLEFPDHVEKPELILIAKEEAENTDLEAEAAVVAGEIRKLTEHGVIRDGEKTRPVRYGDIAILLRSANTVGPVFRRVLIAKGIPVAAGAGGDFYESVEVSEVFSMLRLIDNPHQDIPLISVLCSPSFGFTQEQLSLIRAERKDSDFYTALKASEEEDAKRFLKILSELRAEAPDLTPVELVDRIVDVLDLWAVCSAMPDGEQRLQHLMDLSAMAEIFRTGSEVGVHHFVRWLENMEKKAREPETCIQTADAVQIMSIHRSKGLEFPVVIYSALGRQFNRQDLKDTVLVHPELGLGPKLTDPARKVEYPTVARRAIEKRITQEVLSEEMRLLYVAMTRARERLLLTACVRKTENLLTEAERLKNFDKIPAFLIQSATAPVQWLLPAMGDLEVHLFRNPDESDAAEAAEAAEKRCVERNAELFAELEKNLNWQYPYQRAEELPSKLTATELKGRAAADSDAATLISAPHSQSSFETLSLGEKKLAATRRGTAVHTVLQQISLDRTGSAADIREEIRRLQDQRYLTAEEEAAVQPESILRFFASDLGRRMLHADRLWREFRFSLLTKACDLLPEESSEEKILLQGVVDCCFEENGELVVVDYKTDHVTGETQIRERAEYYRVQLQTYADALERIFERKVKETQLVFLHSGTSVRLS